jgi:hypothetical protein
VKKLRLMLSIDVEEDGRDAAMLTAAVKARLADLGDWRMRAFADGTVAETLAGMGTWSEHARREAIEEMGARTEEDIAAHLANGASSDYVTAQADDLDRMILAARLELGISVPPMPIPPADEEDPAP